MGRPVHVLLCVADHYEPGNGGVSHETGLARVQSWAGGYPAKLGAFRDSDGRPPRHTFFYPLEMYREKEVELLAALCRQGFGEIEVHLHHENDTAEELRRRLIEFRDLLTTRHGQLARHMRTGQTMYGFVHGNWALDNSRPDGRWCGVTNELDILRETGCYADFTMPAYPDACQTRKINSIYYAVGRPGRCKSHDTGLDVGRGALPANALMLIQGPLLLNWRNRKWGIVPRVENACIQGSQPPTMQRLDLWLKARCRCHPGRTGSL